VKCLDKKELRVTGYGKRKRRTAREPLDPLSPGTLCMLWSKEDSERKEKRNPE
jgi:hypothetical protein